MKNTIKKLNYYLLLFTAIIFISCEKDLYEGTLQKDQKNTGINIKHFSLREMENENTNAKLLKVANSIKSRINKTEAKVIYDSNYDFFFDDEKGFFINKDGKNSYTFPIYREDGDDKLENIVFSQNEKGEYDVLLSKYNFNREQLENMTEQEFSNAVIEYTGLVIDGKSVAPELVCVETQSYQMVPIDNGDLTGNFGYEALWVTTGSYCFWTGGNGGSGGADVSGEVTSSGNNGPTPSGGSSGGGGIITAPNEGYTAAQYNFIKSLNTSTSNLGTLDNFMYLVTDAQNSILTYVNDHNTSLQLNPVRYFLQNTNLLWISKQPDATQISIFNYLVQNSFSVASRAFVNEIINTSQVLEINAMLVWEDYNNFRNQMSSSERIIFDGLASNKKLWYMCSAKKAYDKANELFPNSTHNGLGDAYRHALWNGYCVLTIAGNLGEQLTTAHEDRPSLYPFNYKETQMDLYNNNQGRLIAINSNLNNIADNILQNLQQGYLRYLNNLDSNTLATYNSILIPTDQ